MLQITPSESAIGAVATDIDLSTRIDDDAFRDIEDAFNEHQVLCIRDQSLTPPQYIDFARRFGAVTKLFLNHYAHPDYPEIARITNIQENGKAQGHADAGRVWHTDMSYLADPPRATLLYALEVPMENGAALGDTEFASATTAYDALAPDEKDRIADLHAIHDVFGRRGLTGLSEQDQAMRQAQPNVVHPVVRIHPITGRKSIYVSEGECVGIEGMADDDALSLISDLAQSIPQPDNRYRHVWRPGDIVIWDNCAVQHIATFDYEWPRHRRSMQRITVGTQT